ncbi:MAG: hypothetical protein RLZZ338_67 [Cyanobacteriota bacterium]|jgi:diguanylate cyclase (GGDEF)-like protein
MSSIGDKEVVLIVDDNLANLAVLSDFLDDAGFEVWVAQDGESALEKVTYGLPSLILLDVMMPGIDGFQTCKILKSNPITEAIPIIFTTALSDPIDKVRGFTVGAVDYITKPFHQDEVLMRVRLHLQLYSLRKTLEEKNYLLAQITTDLEHLVEERTWDLKGAMKELQQAHLELLVKEERLRYKASHDSLTGLPNRASFLDRLHQVIELAKQKTDYLYAVLFIDLDRFKVINDSLGHLVGDELLKRVAKRMENSLSSENMVARLGGDEFIILLENITDIEQVKDVAQNILSELNRPFSLEHYEVFTGASIGITTSAMGYQEAIEVLKDADVAMYHAKVRGKNRYEILTPTIQTQAVQKLELENDLRKAIDSKEFCLYYQPIVSLKTGELLSFEALVRWHHPRKGLVSPLKFISLAEETGLIHSLGRLIFQQACQQMRFWQQQFSDSLPLILNVNFSPIQLRRIDFIEQITEILQEIGLDSCCLKAEITESCLLDTSNDVSKIINGLKDLGIKLSIDDFGTGYSSLSRLHEFPIDTLKIDRSFVRRMNTKKGEEMIKTILTLARRFDMDVVAEGIETVENLHKLSQWGCEWGQGYLFSPAVAPDSATQLLHDRAHVFGEFFSSSSEPCS